MDPANDELFEDDMEAAVTKLLSVEDVPLCPPAMDILIVGSTS